MNSEIDNGSIIVSEHYHWYKAHGQFEEILSGRREDDTTYAAQVNVFEDRFRCWFLDIAANLLVPVPSPGDYAALVLVLAYVEAIEQYRRGQKTPVGKSGKWFKASAKRILQDPGNEAVRRLWEDTRCGLFHAGFPHGKTFITRNGSHALVLEGDILSIDPGEFVTAVQRDFRNYVRDLRNAGPDDPLRKSFVCLWTKQWTQSKAFP